MSTGPSRHYTGPAISEKNAEAAPGAQLAASFPFVQALHGQRILVVHTGATLFEPEARRALARDMAMLGLLGAQPLLVHGGTPQLQAGRPQATPPLAEQLSLPVQRAALTEINRDLVQQIGQQGIKALGLSGQDGKCLSCKEREAGPLQIILDPQLPELLLSRAILPVIMPVAPDAEGQDQLLAVEQLATQLAAGLQARTLVLLLDTAVLNTLSHPQGPRSRADWEDWLHDHAEGRAAHVIRAALQALTQGVQAVHLLDAAAPSALLDALLTEEGSGLLLCRRSEAQWLSDSSRYFQDCESMLKTGFTVERKRVARF